MDPKFFRRYADLITEAEQPKQLDEGVMDSIKAMVMKIPGISQYIKAAENLKPQLASIAKNSRSGSEALEQVKSLAAGVKQPVIASEGERFDSIALAGLGTAGLILNKLGGFYDSILQYYQQGDVGMAISGAGLTVFPMVIALMMAVVLWQQANEDKRYMDQHYPKQKTIQ